MGAAEENPSEETKAAPNSLTSPETNEFLRKQNNEL